MKLTARDQDQQNALAHAYHDRERFTLTGAGLQAEFVAEVINRVPCSFGSGRYETNLELVQVTEATTQAAWNGEGLPPIGWMVDLKIGKSWQPCEVLAHFNGELVLGWVCQPEGEPVVELRELSEIREHRTAKELAAEERENGITEMRRLWSLGSERDKFSALWDAGYRKFEIMEGE